MRQKPWFVLMLTWSLLLVPVTEIGLYFFTTRVQNIHLPARIVTILWVFGITCLIAAYGVWKVRPWGYISFFFFVLGIFGGDLYRIIKIHSVLTFWEILNVSLVAFGLIFILNKHISTPYFNPRVRWWERPSRLRVDLPTSMVSNGRQIKGQLLDLSSSGCFFDTQEGLIPGEAVSMDITFSNIKFESTAVVIRHMENPQGFGLMFIKTSFKDKKKIKLIISALEKN